MTTSYYVEKGETFRLANGTRVHSIQELVSNLEEWKYSERCVTDFRRLFEDAESSQYYEPDGSLYVPPQGQSDFLYMPMKFEAEFLKA
eukprot:CAMPEP_0202460598 /NCGR_PEP_ID=MMETSP1360-20130828/44900_1 /ASSEMBLY_ACC=CAM_ASM_000848 /TAXON_ID=515479 /ORGANISM="Licmophora paradoxa, Strain CCMP2313" /LENGTH=87 /DNA_ID=CAMNT_0049082323 /DNA_START=19 /DNA_END=279 /DNA_ORIENTATION=+